MAGSNESKTEFVGTYFERDRVLRIARNSGVFAWIILGIYLGTSLISFGQFLLQFASGLYFQKGLSAIDVFGFFAPYLLQPLPGLLYFFALKFVKHALLILLDMEDNTRRAARK